MRAPPPDSAAPPVPAHPTTPPPDPPGEDAAAGLLIPPPRALRYTLAGNARGQPLAGEARLQWQHDGQRYEAWLVQDAATGRRLMHSTGTLQAEGLAPERFGDQQAGDRSRRSEQAAHFERGPGHAARIRFSGNAPDAALEAGTQDRLSLWIQLAAAVAGRAPLKPGATLAFQVASTRELRPWVFRLEAEETLALPGRPLPTLRLRRRPDGPYDLGAEVWLAPALDYLPVRLRLTQESGDWLEQQWAGTDRP